MIWRRLLFGSLLVASTAAPRTPLDDPDAIREASRARPGMAFADSARWAPSPTPALALDSAVRRIVVAGIVRLLYEEIGRAVTDSVSRPWILCAGDSTNEWRAERAGLAKLLRARARTPEDRFVTALFVSGVEVGRDGVLAKFSVVYYKRCDSRWTANWTDYRWIAPRRRTWRVEGPSVELFSDGPECAELARYPSIPGSVLPSDTGAASVQRVP